MKSLSSEQNHFFTLISRIAFANPFSRDREKVDCELLQTRPGILDINERLAAIQTLLSWNLQQLQRHRAFDIRDYQGQEQEILRFSWLFFVFHDVQEAFEAHIAEQQKAGDTVIELGFAERLLSLFDQAGFNLEETARFIALFYQLHRGFHFIDQSVSGESPVVIELRMRLWNNIFTFNPEWYLDHLYGKLEDFSTLLLGETGTGKSLVAKAIGCSGLIPFDTKKRCFAESFTGSFQSINLSQYPASLLESELFGHKKGAFTGAIESHQGLFARCSRHGAVFIDEIGDIDIPTQVKLLNVIQDRIFSPVGSHDRHRFEGRVISATNRDIQQLREKGSFRDDLYYRLCSDVITLPSLRQRLQENPAELHSLIAKLLTRVIRDPDTKLVDRIEKRIRKTVPDNYPWPGNVRELEQCIRRICLAGSYIPETPVVPDQNSGILDRMIAGELSSQDLLREYCRLLYQQHNSYEAVARIVQLDRRTVKKHIVGVRSQN